ncbi:TonB-dependent receptor [Pseudofulvibacter geojedonensis]|uniref:Carboxypeptidase-like regulatory domain-containing protein n=1 Tax=Pseudofulvibacter geojedonensis TaxID=1123758 RepID=A0ABW3I0D6_9FLAO
MLLPYINRLYFILFLFITPFSIAQNNNFKKVIGQIEKKFEVKFSYADKSIEKIELETFNEVNNIATINDFIAYINSNTYLDLVQIDSRYISIALKKNLVDVCGYLKDANGKALPEANIYVLGKNEGTISNQEGFFKLSNLEISDFIEISHLSYETQVRNVNLFYSVDNSCKEYQLTENPIELTTVSIKNYILKSLDKLDDGTISLNTNKFKILGGQVNPDLLQTSQILPGIESHDESIANINVRNGASDQNTVYWDNIKLYHSSHFFGLISGVNPFLTDNISITKDGTSAKYNDGVSSSFFLESDKSIKDSIISSVGVDLVSVDGYIKVPVSKKVQVNASVRRSVNDVFSTPTYESYFEKVFQNNNIGNDSDRTDFSFYDVNLNSIIKLSDRHKIHLNFITINNKLEHQESSDSDLLDVIKQNSIAYGLGYNFDISNKFRANIGAYRTEYKLESNNYQNNQQQLLQQENEVVENSIKTDFNYDFNKNHNINFGYQLNETGVLSSANVNDPFFVRVQKGVMVNHSGFGEYLFRNKKLYSRIGLRFNYFDKINKTTLEPRFNINYQLSRYLNITGKYEQKSQYTSQVIDFLDDFLGIENRRWVITDDKIPLIKSRQFSGGINFNRKKFMADFNIFNKETNGVLISGQGFQNQVRDRRLAGKQRSYGLETIVNKRFNKFNFWSSYTLSKSELLFKEIETNYFPSSNDVSHSNTTGVAYTVNKNLSFSFIYNVKSGKPYSIPEEGNETTQNGSFTVVNYSNLNSERLPHYSRLDASISFSKTIKNKLKIDLKAGVLNVLNTKQSLQRYYVVDESATNNIKEVNINSLQLTPNISIRATF